MKRLLCILLFALLCPLIAAAQDDRGFLQGLIEDNLSGAGRDVRIKGFAGALSSRATLEELTIADQDGIWLTLRGAVLDWNRSALLGGRLEINTLSADELIVARKPVTETATALPSAAAPGFSLPDLPVSVQIGKLAISRAELGETIFGAKAVISLDGTVTLDGGAGSAVLTVARVDGKRGALTLDAAYANATQDLKLDLSLSEEADGIAVNLLNLPGLPSVDLAIDGTGTLSDFKADVWLDTDGVTRLAGAITLGAEPQGEGAPLRLFTADIGGDLAPVFTPQYRPFFGDNIRLVASGARQPDGTLTLSALSLTADSLTLQGQATLAPSGLPETLALTGQIADPAGGAVLLPVGSDPIKVARVDLQVAFDAAQGETWTARIALAGLDTNGLDARVVTLDGTGQIRSDPGTGNHVTAQFDFGGQGLDLGSPEMTSALGSEITGKAAIDWQQGSPVKIGALELNGAGIALTGAGTLDIEASDLAVAGNLQVEIAELSPFSGLAGRVLSGAASARVSGAGDLMGGAFDVDLTARGQDLRLSIPQADPLLRGQSTIEMKARRDATGLTIEKLTVQGPDLTGTLTGKLQSEASTLQARANLREVGLILPQLSGALAFTADANQIDGIWRLVAEATAPGAAKLSVDGKLLDLTIAPSFDGRVRADIGDLSAYATLAKRSLGGAINAEATGTATLTGESLDFDLAITSQDLAVDIPQADALLAGSAQLDLRAMRSPDGVRILSLSVSSPEVTGTASGKVLGADQFLNLVTRLRDVSLVRPDLSGEVRLALEAAESGGDWSVNAKGGGPGTAQIKVDGTFSDIFGAPQFAGQVEADVADLSPYSRLARRALSGSAQARIEGNFASGAQSYDFRFTGSSNGLQIAQPEADKLLAGSARFEADVSGKGNAVLIKRLSVDTPQLDATITGDTDAGAINLSYDIRLANLGLIAPGIDGPLQTTGTARQTSGRWAIDLKANGPAGSRASVAGSLAANLAEANLNINGQAPLALANRFITPNSLAGSASFDLSLNGRPSLAAVSGTIAVAQGRAVLTAGPGLVLNDIGATVALGGARANISLNAAVQGGGQISLSGPVALDKPYSADLLIRFSNVTFSDPSLYKTTVNGDLTAVGPLTGGATVAGTLTLGRTELQIPSTGLGATGEIPDITHLNEPVAVRATRDRAGLLGGGGAGDKGAGPRYPVDVQIVAANQIFIRGRGLDAELGGTLRLTGTSNDIAPSGQFQLVRGRLDILGKRLVIDEGLARMQGNFLPYIRLVASTTQNDVRILITVEGQASDPTISFRSEPELPEDEVLAQLLFGRGIDQISPLQAAQLASAVASLAGRGGVGIIGKLRDNFGLDDLDVATDAEGNAALKVGKYIGEKIYTDVTVGSTSTEINLNLDISRTVTAKGTLSSTGETSLGIFFQRDY